MGYGEDISEHNKKWGSTTHFNVLDEHGNAASISSSNGEGCGHFVPETNIQLNNMLGEAALFPSGFHSWDPGVRISSMMSPTLVLDDQKQVKVVMGTGGAGRIPSAIMQVLHLLLDRGLHLEEAILNQPVLSRRCGGGHRLPQTAPYSYICCAPRRRTYLGGPNESPPLPVAGSRIAFGRGHT